MDTIKSFKGYGKVDETEEAAFQKKVKKRIIIISISAIILFAVIIATVAGVLLTRDNGGDKPSSSSPSQSLKVVCSVTQYPDTCFSSLSPLTSNSTSINPTNLFSLSLQVAKHSVSDLRSILPKDTNDTVLAKGLKDCGELFDDSEDQLGESLLSLSNSNKKSDNDLRTWLSAVLTNLESCVDGVSEINGTASLVEDLRLKMKNSTELVSNSLAIVSKIGTILGKFKNSNSIKVPKSFHLRKLLEYGSDQMFPDWVGPAERRLLLGEEAMGPGADAVVAKDGSGQYKTITEAIKAVTLKSKKRYVIYVKEGVYEENVVMGKHVWNVMMYGDGMDKSIVSGHLNFIDGTPTFSTATFAIAGRGFIAKDMAFKNTAGAEKHQAVAFRSQSDQSIYYRCLFDGYQDTLYAHSYRQFYRECTVTGTIDFIFGNAAVVFQNCNIQPREPLPKQFNTITAQGRKDLNQNTGISIQKCTISGLGQVTAPTYLGRPWQQFSTTLIMQSIIGPVLHPSGWVGWVNGVEPPSTIYYAEYQNTGPGADISKRVTWAGFKPEITADEASKFTVGNFIDGSSWLASTDVAFDTAL
ncbi:hypothetical protein SOVF_001630 [Spinacia oleracea]|nr:hypothetical protein SOVF_001630 [Spinacia oleracea]